MAELSDDGLHKPDAARPHAGRLTQGLLIGAIMLLIAIAVYSFH
jgi:hypothetical protein